MKKQNSTMNAEEKAMEMFAEVIIKHLEQVNVGDWKKPWVCVSKGGWPRNIDGREYSANNALVLMMHTQHNGYAAPIYATFDRISKLNFTEGEKPQRLKDADGKELPFVKVNKGAEHMPVIMTVYSAVHKHTKERIKYEDYKNLSNEEKKDYYVYPRSFVYKVFNIDQTNLKETRPELYEKLVGKVEVKATVAEGDDFRFPAMDAMILKNIWQCPIEVRFSNSAFYNPNADKVVVPQKQQFREPELFYGTLLHECAHSTGAKCRYDRGLSGNMNSKAYAREELIAELTAALVASKYGMEKSMKSDSIPYLKSWLGQLKEGPQFIKELLAEVKKASSQIIRRLEVIQGRIDELRDMGVPEPEYYPDFLELNPITNQPVADPIRYVAKEEELVNA